MKTPNQIVKELKHVVEWSQPNIRYNEIMSLIKQLESSLNPTQKPIPTPVVETIVVKEPVVEEVIVEEPIAEVTEETPAPTKTTRKK